MSSDSVQGTTLSESEVNSRLAELWTAEGFLVLRQLRIGAAEMDLVLLEPFTKKLIVCEIKRRRWREVLLQAIRAQLYGHLVSAVLPVSMESAVERELFEAHGVGLLFYETTAEGVTLRPAIDPRESGRQNKYFKQQVYRQFSLRFGDTVSA